jgi:hypothetical protein
MASPLLEPAGGRPAKSFFRVLMRQRFVARQNVARPGRPCALLLDTPARAASGSGAHLSHPGEAGWLRRAQGQRDSAKPLFCCNPAPPRPLDVVRRRTLARVPDTRGSQVQLPIHIPLKVSRRVLLTRLHDSGNNLQLSEKFFDRLRTSLSDGGHRRLVGNFLVEE